MVEVKSTEILITGNDIQMKYFFDFVDELWPRDAAITDRATMFYKTKLPAWYRNQYMNVTVTRLPKGLKCEGRRNTNLVISKPPDHVEPARSTLASDVKLAKFLYEMSVYLTRDRTYYVMDKTYNTCYVIKMNLVDCDQKQPSYAFNWRFLICDLPENVANRSVWDDNTWKTWLEKNYEKLTTNRR